MPRYLSNSEIMTFQRCQRKWFLQNVMKLGRPERESGVANVGTLAHALLEALYLGHDMDDVLADHRAALEEMPEGKFRDDAALALTVAEGYIDWLAEEGADQSYEAAAVEGEFTRPIDGMPGWFGIGKLDLILRNRGTGELVPSDHKSTAQAIETFLRGIRRRSQWFHYAWLLEGRFPEWPNVRRFLVTVLRQSKRTARSTPPYYARQLVPLNDAEVRSYGRQITRIAQDIQAAEQRELPPPTRGQDCDWACPFARICPRMDDGSDWESQIRLDFVEIDPLARYVETPH